MICLLETSFACRSLTVVRHLTFINNELSMQRLLDREQFHANAFKAYASGDLPEACIHLEKSVVEYPRGYYHMEGFSYYMYIVDNN